MRDRAVPYYVLAIASFLYRQRSSQARDAIQNDYSYREPESGEVINLLFDSGVFQSALRQMNSDDLIELIEDEFGPEIIVPTEALYYWMNNVQDRGTNWYKYSVGGDRWLRSALQNIYDRMIGLRQETDSPSPTGENASLDVWEPIKIERTEIEPVIKAIESAIDEIAENNGYAAEHSSERNYVVTTLRSGIASLKVEGEIALLKFRTFILEPLAIAFARFADAATGLAIGSAKEAVKAYLKDKVKGGLDGFF